MLRNEIRCTNGRSRLQFRAPCCGGQALSIEVDVAFAQENASKQKLSPFRLNRYGLQPDQRMTSRALQHNVNRFATFLAPGFDHNSARISEGRGLTSMTVRDCALVLCVAAGVGLLVPPALAQSLMQPPPSKPLELTPWGQIAPPPPPEDSADDEAEDVPAAKTADADPMKDVDVSKLDWSQLNVDANGSSDHPGAKTGAGKPVATEIGRAHV